MSSNSKRPEPLVKLSGLELNEEQKQSAFKSFPGRMTWENRPDLIDRIIIFLSKGNIEAAGVLTDEMMTDDEWLASHYFYFRGNVYDSPKCNLEEVETREVTTRTRDEIIDVVLEHLSNYISRKINNNEQYI